MVKISRTMRKMEQSKRLEPCISDAFRELSDVLLQNYKENSSYSSSLLGGSSPNTAGISNQLRDKAH